MKRSVPLRRTRLRSISAKTRRAQPARRHAVAVALERADGRCEAPAMLDSLPIDGWLPVAKTWPDCWGGLHPHEPWTRARGGPTDDPDRIVIVCAAHHDWAHSNPGPAVAVGLLAHSWEGDDRVHGR